MLARDQTTNPEKTPSLAARLAGPFAVAPRAWPWHWPFGLVLVVYLLTALQYSLSVPAWETPDEPAHFAYIHHIRTTGGPPIQSFVQGQNEVETGHHPPLYYYIGSLATLPIDLGDFNRIKTNPYFSFSNTDGGINRFEHNGEATAYPNTLAAVRVVRAVSLLFGAGTLLCIYLSGLLLFGGAAWGRADRGRLPATLAAALAGFLPQFCFLSGSVNNDNAVIFFCALALLLSLRLALLPATVRPGWLGLVGLGAVVGLGLLSKYNALVCIPLVGLAITIAAMRRRSPSVFIKGALLSGAGCVAIAGWWFGRAQLLYGDPAGWSMWRSSFRSVDQSESFRLTGAFMAHLWERWFNSFWGYFGWFNLPLEPVFYKWLARLTALMALGLTGWVLSATLLYFLKLKKTGRLHRYLSPFSPLDLPTWVGLVFCSLLIGLTGLIAFNYAATFGDAGTQGRYLFPALPALALLGSGGLLWFGRGLRLVAPKVVWLAPASGWLLAVGLGCGLVWLNQHALNDLVRPAYLPDQQLRAQLVVADLPAGAVRLQEANNFLPAMQLEGYTLSAPRNRLKPGELKVTFYWRATREIKENWVNFTHLVNGDQTFSQSDGPPGQGRFQVYRWRTGELIKDERTLRLEEWQLRQLNQFNLPLRLYLGWLRTSDGARASLQSGGDAITLDWK